MNIEKIYINLLDNVPVWIPIDARPLGDNKFEILNDEEFSDYIGPLSFHEFFPGDIVELDIHVFSDGKDGLVAARLIKAGNWPDRKLKEFKFKAAMGQLVFDDFTAEKYKLEIDIVRKEISQGQIYYQSIHDTIDNFKMLTE